MSFQSTARKANIPLLILSTFDLSMGALKLSSSPMIIYSIPILLRLDPAESIDGSIQQSLWLESYAIEKTVS